MPKIVDEQMREATRQRILREAAREFARLGFDQANINVIAEQAGIGKGTIYLYFENKRDVFVEMLRSHCPDAIGNDSYDPCDKGNIAATSGTALSGFCASGSRK